MSTSNTLDQDVNRQVIGLELNHYQHQRESIKSHSDSVPVTIMAVTGRYLFTQPETILAILSVVAIYFTFHLGAESTSDILLKMIHFTSFSVYVGMSFWVTFVAGLAMYRIIPRHLFSQVQSVLFPKFVRYCMIFSSLSLISYYLLVKSTSNGLPLKKVSVVLRLPCSPCGVMVRKPEVWVPFSVGGYFTLSSFYLTSTARNGVCFLKLE
ncbi:TMEM205 [Bugula neritina]|uniref:TMEM205 n=1 Tax=Bugula neritina TaxID=10212 RepID=A0A7J7K1F4_BUGNE|nr:TMEM205 [Bugula neritina]